MMRWRIPPAIGTMVSRCCRDTAVSLLLDSGHRFEFQDMAEHASPDYAAADSIAQGLLDPVADPATGAAP